MNGIKRVGKLIRNNIIIISASLIFIASIAISIYLNEPQAIGDLIMASLLTSAYVIVTEVAIRFAQASLEPI